MMGVMCAIGGIVFAARMNSGQPAANVNLEFDAITAVILGGVSFTGGVGTMGGTIIGVFLIQAFNTGLTIGQRTVVLAVRGQGRAAALRADLRLHPQAEPRAPAAGSQQEKRLIPSRQYARCGIEIKRRTLL